jgi:hypothetical protein
MYICKKIVKKSNGAKSDEARARMSFGEMNIEKTISEKVNTRKMRHTITLSHKKMCRKYCVCIKKVVFLQAEMRTVVNIATKQ